MNSVLFARLSGLILNYFAAILVREIVFKEFNDVVIEIISEQLAEVNLKVERAARAVYLFVDTDEMLLLAKAAATEVRDWDWVLHDALDVFCDVAEAKETPPAFSLHILEDDVSADVRFVAANDARGKDAAIGFDIADSDVMYINKRLGLAASNRVRHTTWTRAIRLFLLLWANVNSPPKGPMHLNVVVKNVCDAAARAW